MGYGYPLKIPFTFGSVPLAGYVYDRTGSYDAALLIFIAAFLAAALAVGVLRSLAGEARDQRHAEPDEAYSPSSRVGTRFTLACAQTSC